VRQFFIALAALSPILPFSGHAVRPGAQKAGADPYAIATLCLPAARTASKPTVAASGEEFQAALDKASAGDTIVLAAGKTFESPAGGFVLRNRPIERGQWITIRSSSRAFDPGGVVPPGTRVTPDTADAFAHIRATKRNVPAIRSAHGAHGYHLIGLDIGAADGIDETQLVELGDATDTTIATEPSDVVVDRCFVHGNDRGRYRRGVALNGARLAVVDSHVSGFRDPNTDSQAISGWNGPGPFKIVNNYLEAASENILFGGGDPAVPDLVPSDIEIRRNLCTKRLAWRDERVPVKNAFELKNARRVVVSGNVFENVWASGQDGTAIVLKSANQEGRCTWCVTEYVTFSDNIVRQAAHGVLVNAAETGPHGGPQPKRVNHIRIVNDLFEAIGAEPFKGGKLFRIFGGVDELTIAHVTSTSNPTGILDPRNPADSNPHLTFTDNIVERSQYGVGAGADEGTRTLTRNFAPFVFERNVIVNASAPTGQAIKDGALKARYPPGTTVASGWASVGVEPSTKGLTPNSPYRRAGAGGTDPGADVAAIAASQAGPPSTAPCAGAEASSRAGAR
jgi:hypothetical protein